MGLNDRIREARLMRHMTQEQLSEKIGVAKSTLTGYEKGNREPNIPTLMKIMETLHVDANYLYQDEMGALSELVVSMAERDLITKYRDLDDRGKEHVSTMLNWETERVQAHIESTSQITVLQQQLAITASDKLYLYTYLRKIACAGTGFYFDDIPTTTIEVPYIPGADFVIGVSGDSMEPDYHDGERLYIQKVDSLSIGDVGIFTVWGECFVKELGERGLISKNPTYDDIPGTEDVRLIGRVLGKVEEM